jgi:hypothetical protein
MTKNEIKEFRLMARHIAIKIRGHRDIKEDQAYIEDYLMHHGAKGIMDAFCAWRIEAARQQKALEFEYEAAHHLAIAAFFANGCDHTASAVQAAIRKAEAAGKLIGKDRDDVERDIAEECEARE